MTDTKYYVFGMKSKAKDYVVDMISVENTYLLSLENAKIIKEKLEAGDDYETVKFYFSSQFKETKKRQIIDRIKHVMQPFEFLYPFLVVDKNKNLWSHFKTKESAQNTVIDKNKPEQKYKSDLEKQPFKIITWTEYNAAEKAREVTKPVQISKARYWDLLECLPPMKWHTTSEGLNVFFMSEFNTGSYTQQIVKQGTCEKDYTYYSKGVDYHDKSTWCTVNDLSTVTTCEAP